MTPKPLSPSETAEGAELVTLGLTLGGVLAGKNQGLGWWRAVSQSSMKVVGEADQYSLG